MHIEYIIFISVLILLVKIIKHVSLNYAYTGQYKRTMYNI